MNMDVGITPVLVTEGTVATLLVDKNCYQRGSSHRSIMMIVLNALDMDAAIGRWEQQRLPTVDWAGEDYECWRQMLVFTCVVLKCLTSRWTPWPRMLENIVNCNFWCNNLCGGRGNPFHVITSFWDKIYYISAADKIWGDIYYWKNDRGIWKG